jgi:hypothetical protein
MTDTWYYVRDGQREQLIAALIRSPNWQQEFVWKPEYAAWLEAGTVNELSFEIAQSDRVQHPVQYESHGAFAKRPCGQQLWFILDWPAWEL